MTSLPDPAALAAALDRLGRATGYPLYGARLALAKGDLSTASRCYLEHQRLIRNRTIPRVPAGEVERDGIDPAELLRRTNQLPTRHDTKGTRR